MPSTYYSNSPFQGGWQACWLGELPPYFWLAILSKTKDFNPVSESVLTNLTDVWTPASYFMALLAPAFNLAYQGVFPGLFA